MKDKFILDACCGTKMFWTNKNHPNVLYMDIREEEKGFIEQQQNLSIKPDVIGDFTNLPDEVRKNKYKLIIWDVPHFVKRKITGIMLKKFGCLSPETWQSDINKGFKELWNVLDDYGVLLFKFSDYHIKFNDILNCISEKPLVFNRMNSKGGTECKWFCFMKIPEQELLKEVQEGEGK
jgi:hypothetical protein